MAPVVDCLAASCLDNGEAGSGMEEESVVESDSIVAVNPSTEDSDEEVMVGDALFTPGNEEELTEDFRHDLHVDSDCDSGWAADEDEVRGDWVSVSLFSSQFLQCIFVTHEVAVKLSWLSSVKDEYEGTVVGAVGSSGLNTSFEDSKSFSESMFSGGMDGLDFRKNAIFSLETELYK